MADRQSDPFEIVAVEEAPSEFVTLSARALSTDSATPVLGATIARFIGFDLNDCPVVSGVAEIPGEVLAARATVPMQSADVGAAVVVLFEGGDLRRPIIVGVLQQGRVRESQPVLESDVSVESDGERVVIAAQREIVLRCGDASITLTRAGKVIIKGTYVLSRSSGYNKIKGAAVDIN